MKGRQVMSHNIYIYILVMAGVSYLIRMLPLTLIRKEIKNKTIRSFLYYVPYVTLAVMTFPAILSATGSVWSAWAALIVATALAGVGQSLLQVSECACVQTCRILSYRHRTGLFLFYFAISLLYFSHIFILHLAHTCLVRNVFLYVCCLSLAGML